MSPQILKLASLALIVCGIILIGLPLAMKFGLIEGKTDNSNLVIGLIFLILGLRTRRRFNKQQ